MPRQPRRPLRRAAAAGYTLMEALVVCAIVGILASISLPSFGGAFERIRLKNAAEGLAADLAEARFEAARRGQALHVSLHGGANWCYAVATTPGCDCRQAQPCQLRRVDARALPGVTLEARGAWAFDAEGMASEHSSASWHLARGDELRVASAGLLGRARVCSPDGRFGGYARC